MNNLIAYNQDNLNTLIIMDKAKTWHNKQWISNESWNKIKAYYSIHFYSPNVFMRIGGFIFCSILLIAILALLALFAGGQIDKALPFLAFVLGIASIAFLEFVIKSKNHYKSGIDDALLYGGLSLIIGGLTEILGLNTSELPFYCLFLPILMLAAIRYLDSLITIVAYLFSLAIVILITFKFPSIAPLILSFVIMFFAIMMYLSTIKMQKNNALIFWQNNLNILEGLSLILFYASGNYFILQQANQTYFENPSVAFAPLFWAFTVITPFIYIYQGLKQKNRLLLSIGLLAIAAAVATFRYYFHVMPMEIAAIMAGALLLAMAYFSIKYLKENKTPFTYEEDGDKPFYHQAESLIIAQSFGNQQVTEGEKPVFGGGDFGGGGAGNEF
jgi:hypothetical protein